MMKRKRPLEINDVPLTKLDNSSSIWGAAFDTTPNETDKWLRFDTALLGYNQDGVIELMTETKSLVVSPGMITFIPANLIHQQQIRRDRLSGWFVSIPVELTAHLPQEICTFQGSDLLMALIQKITSLTPGEAKTESEQRMVETFVDELRQAKVSVPLTLPMPLIPSLREVAQRIIRAPEDMNGLDHWAKEAAMSRRSFTRHFNKETGLSFMLWRQLAKVYAAVHQLAQGKTVKEVSANLGYKDSSTFIALFKKTFGTSPKKYFYSENLKAHTGITAAPSFSKKKLLVAVGIAFEMFEGLQSLSMSIQQQVMF